MLTGRQQPLELVLAVLGYDEEQLVAGLDGLLGVGHVDLPVAQDRDQGAVVGERDQPGGLADVRRVRGQGELHQVGVALPERDSRTRSPTVTASSTRADMIRGVETLTSTPQ